MKREGEVRIPSGCAISGIIDKSGKRFSGEAIIDSIALMHDRSNGLGGGFAGYGIYPEYADFYAFHIFYDSEQAKIACEEFLHRNFSLTGAGEIPTRLNRGVKDAPMIWRYFASPIPRKQVESLKGEREFVSACVFHINEKIPGAFVFSSGKNMGIFKAVGYPEDVGDFYRLEEYSGYSWTAHGRYPTNTPGWWGGAHPFGILDYSVVHNGEISSYDANRRAIEMYGYHCDLLTDTEAIAYIFDYLLERQHLTLQEAAMVTAASFWENIDALPEAERAAATYLRKRFPRHADHRPLFHHPRLHRRPDGPQRPAEAAQHGGGRKGEPSLHRLGRSRNPHCGAGAGPRLGASRRRRRDRHCERRWALMLPQEYISPEFEVLRDPCRCIQCRALRAAVRQSGASLRRGGKPHVQRQRRLRGLPALRVHLPDPRAADR